jgi:hypothetical protein
MLSALAMFGMTALTSPEGRWLSWRKRGDLFNSLILYNISRSETLATFMPVVGLRMISDASKSSILLIATNVELRW